MGVGKSDSFDEDFARFVDNGSLVNPQFISLFLSGQYHREVDKISVPSACYILGG